MLRAVLSVRSGEVRRPTSKPAPFFNEWSTDYPLGFRISYGIYILVRHNYHENLTWTLAVQVNKRTVDRIVDTGIGKPNTLKRRVTSCA